MRKKTTERHKMVNTFRFQGEKERRNKIVVNATVNLRDGLHYVENQDDADSSQLYKAICHWTDLNQHSEFTGLLSKLGQEIKTLPQVLHQKERIVTLLVEQINCSSVAYLDGVLGLIDSVVRDLQQEFVPYLPSALNNLTELILTVNSAEMVQICLNCYSNLLKHLRSSIIKGFEQYLKIFSRLLTSNVKTHIVENAAKCFEFVTSKAAKVNPMKFLEKLNRILKSNKEDLRDGIATLLYTMMTSKAAYHPINFSHCLWLNDVSESKHQIWEEMILSLVKKLKTLRNMPPGSSVNLPSLWTAIKDSFIPSLFSSKCSFCVQVINAMMISEQKSTSFTSTVICEDQMTVIRYMIDNPSIWKDSSKSDVMHLICTLTNFEKFDLICLPFIQLFIPSLDSQQLEELDYLLRPQRENYLKVVPILGQAYTNQSLATQTSQHDHPVSPLLSWYSDMLLDMQGGVDLPNAIVNHPANRFSGMSLPCYYFKERIRSTVEVNDSLGLESFVTPNCVDFINVIGKNLESLKEGREEEYLRYLLVLKQFDLSQYSKLKRSILELLNAICSSIAHPGVGDFEISQSLLSVMYMTLEALSRSCDGSELLNEHTKNILDHLIDFCVINDENLLGFSLWALKFLDLLLFMFRGSTRNKKELLSQVKVSSLHISRLSVNLASGFKIVRSLTLSILAVLTTDDFDTEYKGMSHIFQQALENELNEFDLVNMDHEPNYHKIEQYMRQVDGTKLEVILKYLLGLMFQNNTKIWDRIINLLTLASKKLGLKSFWGVISPRFTLLHSSDNLKSSILEDVGDDLSNFLQKIKTVSFGFIESTSPPVGREDKLDFISYKVNMWKIILALDPPIPIYIQEEILLRIHDLHSIVASPKPFVGVKKDPKSKAALSVLIPALEALLQCSGSKENVDIQNICLSLLPGPKIIQKPIIGILRSMSSTINDFMTKMEDLGDDQWLKKIYLMSFSGSTPDFTPCDRPIFVDFILRLLLSLDAETKGASREIINKFLCNCTEEEVRRYTSYIFGNLSDWQGLHPLPLKAIIAHINNISNMLSLWRYSFPNLATELITRVCHFVMLADEVNSCAAQAAGQNAARLDENVIQHRKKAVLTAGRSCVIKFFALFESLPMSEDTLNIIFEAIIWSNQENFKIFASNSISWLLQLIMIWSKNPRFHVLFTKCQNQAAESTVLHKMFDIFDSKFLKSKPRLHLMEIVSNLVEDTEDEEMDVDNDGEQKPPVEPIQCGECLPIEMEDERRLGVALLLAGRDKLLNVIADKSFFQDAVLFQNAAEKYTKFLRLFAQHSTDQKINGSICSAVIDILPKFRNKHSDLIGLFELVGDLLNPFQPKDSIVIKLGTCLVWACGKGSREALCQALVVAMKNKSHAQLIQNLNAYTHSVSDEPDFKRRQKAYEKLNSLIANCDRFKTVLFSILTSTCFHFLTHETDTGMLLVAQTLLETIAVKLGGLELSADSDAKRVEEKKIRNYMETIVIPRLKAGVKSKTDSIFDNYLKVLSVFSAQCHKFHGTLKGVHAVFQQEDQDILLELMDIQLSLKARAANKFELLWPVMRNEPSAVVHFAIPILSHHLLDKTKLKVSHQNLIQCSLEALKWCTIALPHGSYFKYLEAILENVPHDEPALMKQYHKILGNIIDGFHYELDPTFLSTMKSERPSETLVKSHENSTDKIGQVENGNNCPIEASKETDGNECKTQEQASITVRLNFAESKSCLTTMTKKFIPKLRKYLHLEEKATHKLSRSASDSDGSLIKKIPTTLAYVKLLQKLPQAIRKSHMIWVIPTLCSSLNSKLISVRGNVKETLGKIVQELGPEVFPDIVRSCKSYLTRGFQKHVRNHALLYILQTLKDSFLEKPKCVPVKEILPLIEDELFGYMAEDKNVEAILLATPEAKRKNGLQLLVQCGMFVTTDFLDELLKCPVERAKTAKTLQTIATGKQWVNEISRGISANQNVQPFDLLQFLFVQLETHCGDHSTPKDVSVKSTKYLMTTPDAFILPNVNKQVAKEGKHALGIVISNFVFTTLCGLLKDKKLKSEPNTLQLLDAFSRRIVDGKRDEALEIRTPSLRCLVFMLSFPLKCFEDPNFLRKMWQKYFLAVNDAFQNEEINMYYKFLTTFFGTFTDHRIDSADLKLLIKCIYKHLQENKCTSSALVLLQNILHRKIHSTDVLALVKEVKRHIWTDCPMHLQEGCRVAYLVYMQNFMTQCTQFMADFSTFFEKLTSSISHTTAHSILAMIASMIQVLPKSWLSSQLRTDLTLDLLTALCKMKEPESQRLVSDLCMKNFFDLLDPQEGLETLRDLEKYYGSDEMIPYQRELCITVRKIMEHKKCWGSEVATLKVMTILSKVLKPTNFAELRVISKTDLKQEYRDHGIFQGLLAAYQALDLVISRGNIDSQVFKEIEIILKWIRTDYITYNHEWVQSTAIKCINTQMTVIIELMGKQNGGNKLRNFMEPLNSGEDVLFLVRQYSEIAGKTKLDDTKILVLDGLASLAVLAGKQESKTFHESLLKRIRYCINNEVRNFPTNTIMRETMFKFCRKYVSEIREDNLEVVQWPIARMTTREVTDSNCPAEIVLLCKSTQETLKERLGHNVFIQLYNQARNEFSDKRENSRAKKKEQVVVTKSRGTKRKKDGATKFGISSKKKQKRN